MLFLFKGETKGTAPMPPDQFMELAVKQVETLSSFQKRGKILAGGIAAGRRGSSAIWNVDSIEELQSLLTQLPMFPFTEAEVIPLLNYDKALENAKHVLASLKAARK
ncbi:MAG: muconolactone delta-isomerase [Dehalococcoidales bacterium]|nr:muconolactone delta-isomerase [Dehalococcoidales bacterium]